MSSSLAKRLGCVLANFYFVSDQSYKIPVPYSTVCEDRIEEINPTKISPKMIAFDPHILH